MSNATDHRITLTKKMVIGNARELSSIRHSILRVNGRSNERVIRQVMTLQAEGVPQEVASRN